MSRFLLFTQLSLKQANILNMGKSLHRFNEGEVSSASRSGAVGIICDMDEIPLGRFHLKTVLATKQSKHDRWV
jgi:hypothetical protein